MWKLEDFSGVIVERMDDGRIAFYDGEYSWLVPDDGGQDDGEQFYYMQDMTEDDALGFLF